MSRAEPGQQGVSLRRLVPCEGLEGCAPAPAHTPILHKPGQVTQLLWFQSANRHQQQRLCYMGSLASPSLVGQIPVFDYGHVQWVKKEQWEALFLSYLRDVFFSLLIIRFCFILLLKAQTLPEAGTVLDLRVIRGTDAGLHPSHLLFLV